MIRVVGYIGKVYVCEDLPDTAVNRNMIQYALGHGMTAAIMRL